MSNETTLVVWFLLGGLHYRGCIHMPFKRIPFLTKQTFMECNCWVLFPVHLVSLNLLTWVQILSSNDLNRAFLLFIRFWWASWLSHFSCASQGGFIFPQHVHTLKLKAQSLKRSHIHHIDSEKKHLWIIYFSGASS